MPNKALTIDVNKNEVLEGSLDNWKPIENITKFIENIQTPQLSAKTDVGRLVSGIPSAFARVDLFKTAIDHVSTSNDMPEDNNGSRNLVSY